MRDALALASELTGHTIEAEVNQSFVRENEVLRLGGDSTHLKLFVPDWNPRPFRETLAWMLAQAISTERR